jgi:hypothetical protein
MPKLGLSTKINSSGITTPGIVTDNLVMKHMYPAGAVQLLSDGAAYFDGVNSGIYLSDPFNNQTFTVSAWVYRIDDGNSHAIFSARDNSTDGFILFISDDEYVRAKVNSTTSDEVAATLITANTWNHVVATVTDNSLIQVYVNGAFGDDKALSGSVANTTNARIGLNSYDTGNDYEGYICNVGYWDRVLTQAEIKSIMWKQYADLSTSEKTDLVSWWNLDDTSIASQHEYNVTIDSVGTLGSELFHSPLTLSNFAAQGNNTIEFDSSNDNALKITYVDDDDGVKFYLSNSGGTYRVLTDNPVSGDVYKFTFQAKSNITDTQTYFRTSSDTNYKVHLINNSDWQEFTIYHKCQSTTGDFFRMINLSSAEIVWMKDFSFKRLSGNHGTLQ